MYIYTAVDRRTYQIIDFMIVKHRTKYNTKRFIDRIRKNYPDTTDYHTDCFNNYKSYFDKEKDLNHTNTKDNTTQVESFNAIFTETLR